MKTIINLIVFSILLFCINGKNFADVNNKIEKQSQTEILLQHISEKSKNKNYFKQNVRYINDITDLECLAFAMYGEARGEGMRGMTAVAFVIHNRLKKWHMSTYCNVITQKAQFQFSINPPKSKSDYTSWDDAVYLAHYLINQQGFDKIASPVHSALYFNSLSSQDDWKNYKLLATIGNHYFYK